MPVPLVVVMGVSGCGKSTVGQLLARRVHGEFLEGDLLHPQRNIDRMAAGIALTDNDRRDWLLEIAQQLADAHASQHALVVSCSALKRSYRDTLRAASNHLAFVHLHADTAVLAARMQGRPGHFMPASLLASQLETLEPRPGRTRGDVRRRVARRTDRGTGRCVAGPAAASRREGQTMIDTR